MEIEQAKKLRVCAVDGCSNQYRHSGYCNKHYLRVRKHGNPHTNKRTLRGEEHHNYKGGVTKNHDGYILKRAEGHPRAHKCGHYVFEHILVMENHLGRYLDEGEIIHHIDGDKTNNDIENLEVVTRSQHGKHHCEIGDFNPAWWKGKKQSEEHKEKVSIAKTKWWEDKRSEKILSI